MFLTMFCILSAVATTGTLAYMGASEVGKALTEPHKPQKSVEKTTPKESRSVEAIMTDIFVEDMYRKFPILKEIDGMTDEEAYQYILDKHKRLGHL